MTLTEFYCKCFDGLLTEQGRNQNDVSLANKHEEDVGYQEYLQHKHTQKQLRQQTLTQMALERRAPTPPRPPLPSDWSAIVDQASGRSFYLNETTQDIVFTKTEVFQFEDRKRNAANWALNNNKNCWPDARCTCYLIQGRSRRRRICRY